MTLGGNSGNVPLPTTTASVLLSSIYHGAPSDCLDCGECANASLGLRVRFSFVAYINDPFEACFENCVDAVYATFESQIKTGHVCYVDRVVVRLQVFVCTPSNLDLDACPKL